MGLRDRGEGAAAPREGEERRDLRLDRAAAWALAFLIPAVLAIQVKSFSDLAGEVRSLREDLSRVNSRLAVIEAAALDTRLRLLERESAERSSRSGDLERRVNALEGKR